MTKEERFAISWCYSRAMDYVEKHSPTKNPYEHHTGPLDLIVNGVNISEIIKELLNDQEPHPLDVVATFIEDAGKYGLVPEVVCFALQYMKDNPDSSIEDAMNYGYNEWIK